MEIPVCKHQNLETFLYISYTRREMCKTAFSLDVRKAGASLRKPIEKIHRFTNIEKISLAVCC